MIKDKKIGIIGLGNMGEAIISRLKASRNFKIYSLVGSERDIQRRDYIRRKYKICVIDHNQNLVRSSNVIIIAVKPQDVNEVLNDLRTALIQIPKSRLKTKLIISIAAGVTTEYIRRYLGLKLPVIRVMPNSPALIGRGISCLSLGRYAKLKEERIARLIFESVGEVVRVNEKQMDIITAISGSGPAYFFFFMDCLIKASLRFGLRKDLAKRLVLQTASGSVDLVIHTNQDLEALRQKVASKGGTTEAAFKVFRKRKFYKVIERAVERALLRSQQLSKF